LLQFSKKRQLKTKNANSDEIKVFRQAELNNTNQDTHT